MRAILLLLGGLLISGCTAAMPPDECPTHLQIKWRADFDAARADAVREKKPILLVSAAGDITGFC